MAASQITLPGLTKLARDYLNDWEYEDRLQSSLTDVATSVPVLDGTNFGAGDILQVDNEYMYVSSVSTNTLTVRRGWRNSTAVTHPNDATILRSTTWTDDQLKNWINESFYVIYPWLYVRSEQEITGSASTYDYSLESAVEEVSQVERVEAKYGSNDARTVIRGNLMRLREDGSTVKIYLPASMSGYTITVTYVKPFDILDSDAAESAIPTRAKLLPVYYTASRALEQREALRSRYDGYEVTQNERMVREGQQQAAGRYYWDLFTRLRHECRMPPPGRM